jgi:short-subunit dehydrogenase
MANTEQLRDKVIVITGASSGFGKGAAREFAQAGANLVLAARREELIEDLARECESLGGKAVAVRTDVRKPEEVELLAKDAVREFGRIDIWINNAGVGAVGRFEDVPIEDHIAVIETTLLGTVYGSYHAMRQFRAQGRGTLINMASVIGKVPSPYFASYAAAKHGVVGLSAVLRQELSQDKIDSIKVSTIMPTSMDTPFFQHAATYTGHETQPIPPVYDARETVDTIVRMAIDPEDEVAVGGAGKASTFLHHLMPGIIESMMARQTRKAEFEKAPPAPPKRGSVHEPESKGEEVSGGWKKK